MLCMSDDWIKIVKCRLSQQAGLDLSITMLTNREMYCCQSLIAWFHFHTRIVLHKTYHHSTLMDIHRPMNATAQVISIKGTAFTIYLSIQ